MKEKILCVLRFVVLRLRHFLCRAKTKTEVENSIRRRGNFMNLFNYFLLLYCVNHKDEYTDIDECRLDAYNKWYVATEFQRTRLLNAERDLYFFGGDEDDD